MVRINEGSGLVFLTAKYPEVLLLNRIREVSMATRNILFAQAEPVHFYAAGETAESPPFSAFYQLLQNEGYHIGYTTEALTHEHLAETDVLVIGVPEYVFDTVDTKAVEQFVINGGALLLVTNAATMLNPPHSLNKMAAIAGLRFQEYLNARPTYLQTFRPHIVAGNVSRVRVGRIASLSLLNGASPVALTKATQEPVMACANVGHGRVAAIGDVDWLTNEYFDENDNRHLLKNTLGWLTATSAVEIKTLSVPQTVEWGQSATVVLEFLSNYTDDRLTLKWILDSDAGALVEDPVRYKYALPPGKLASIQWQLHPKKLGDQALRLVLEKEGEEPVHFDQFPPLICLAPGYFTLQMKDKAGNLKTTFQTGDSFTVEGVFHWTAVSSPPQKKLQLKVEDGLMECGHQPGHGIDRWHLEATKPGDHRITLGFEEGDQSLSALVKVNGSPGYQLDEIYAAYVYPLDAEIAERLRQVDSILSDESVKKQPFEILPTDEFVQKLYAEEAAVRVSGMLAAARREQWFNPALLDIILEYFVPTYLPNRGAFIPYDPELASHLANLHITDRRYLEYNLLCSNESGEIPLKQNIAAYLLHEKYGHGFFYSQTRLGKQIALMERYRPNDPLLEVIKDSAIIVNEGFATWMELTFLEKLDREIRSSTTARRILLLEEGTGLFDRETNRFFNKFPPRFDSRYREGFEYLDYIGRTFNLRCAVRVFLIAASVDLGIVEKSTGELDYDEQNEHIIVERLLETEKPDWRSHFRLRRMAELILENERKAKEFMRKQKCPKECQEKGCPLEEYISDQLKWRVT